MADWQGLLTIATAVFAFVPLGLAMLARRRTPTARVSLFATAFAAFAARGVVRVVHVFWWPEPMLEDAVLILDAMTVLFFFLGIIKE